MRKCIDKATWNRCSVQHGVLQAKIEELKGEIEKSTIIIDFDMSK